jgi:c-di-GMP-binding flagellar brake protein YcgR
MFDRRRKFMRFEAPLCVEFESASKNDHFLGLIKDFSREGCSLIAQQFDFPLNSTIELKMQLPEQTGFAAVWGDVVWSKEQEGKHYAGIKFREIDSGVKQDILGYAYQRWVETCKSKA